MKECYVITPNGASPAEVVSFENSCIARLGGEFVHRAPNGDIHIECTADEMSELLDQPESIN